MGGLMVKEFPLSNRGRFFLYLSYLFSFLILVLGVYAYLHLPQKVAVHFDLHGNPDRYGSKTEILGVFLIFFVVSFVFSLFITKGMLCLKTFLTLSISLHFTFMRRNCLKTGRLTGLRSILNSFRS